jgi:sulfotransferase family protein
MSNPAQSVLAAPPSQRMTRNTAPVFVVGCPRSGTTYLYHVLLSAGNFAIYRAESQVFHLLEPRFGDLSVAGNRRDLLAAWFKSRLFTATGLKPEPLGQRVLGECRNGGDFLRIVMDEMAQQQGVKRWAECTPDHILYLPRIKRTIPDALVIHIIRDGRDVALSMEKQGWPKLLPWDRMNRRMAGGVYWNWMVRVGQRDGAKLGADYIEVRYEDLVIKPREVLSRLSVFIDQELDYDAIQKAGIGSVSRPNSSFREEGGSGAFSPVGRWKKFYSEEESAMFEALVDQTLQELRYESSNNSKYQSSSVGLFRAQYEAFFAGKFFLKTQTPLGRYLVTRDLSRM